MVGVRQSWRKTKDEQHEWLVLRSLGDTANEQVVFPAYGAPDGESDNMINALKLVTNLRKRKKFGVVVLLKTVTIDLRRL